MHTLTIRTKFTFGDRVRWKPITEFRVGTGTVVGIMVCSRQPADYRYVIEADDDRCLQDIRRESDLTYLDPD